MHTPKLSLSPTELLIAGLMLGLMGAVVTPALRNSSETAALMRCRSNLYEIGQAAYLYASDHDGQIPPCVDPSTGLPKAQFGSYVVNRSFGFLLAERDGGSGPADYIGRPHPLFCPSSRPELFEMQGYKRPDEIDENNPITRMGYLWIYYPPGDRRSNASVTDDPHRVLAFDFPAPGTAGVGSTFSVSPHPPVLNVLHVGGHVSAVSSAKAVNYTLRDAFYDWMTEESRAAHTNPFTGGNP